MSIAEMQTATISGAHGGRPTDEELDLFGITHEGKVRPDNQDHFLLCTIHPQIVIHGTSLPDPDSLPLRGSRLGTMMLVADGVGGAADGSEAARLASEAVMRYVSSSMRCYHTAGSTNDDLFLDALRTAALQAHDAVRAEAASRPDQRRMATTLTLGIGVWPWLYVVQVGDSRCYVYSGKKLRQVTRDQTLGQQLVDDGAMRAEQLKRSPLRNVLSSAIGGDEATPVVARVDVSERGCVLLFCSDGLTKHVSDDEIAQHFANVQSAEQVSRDLLQLALDRGGSDNITMIVARAPLTARKGAA
jgi:serine/threonine protein phosphatase PrpC